MMVIRYATSPEINRNAENCVMAICEGKEAEATAERLREALIKENRRRHCHGDSELAYSIVVSGVTTSMSP